MTNTIKMNTPIFEQLRTEMFGDKPTAPREKPDTPRQPATPTPGAETGRERA